MPPAPSNRPDPDETPVTSATPVRDRGDACPGALRLHSADDGALARVRVPAGVLSAAQAYTLADAAERLGDGALDITSRGNLQLRGLEPGCAGELARLLDAAGLLPAPRHERVRNVVASPLSGLDGRGHLDVQPLVRELDALLCASERAPELSGRFLFALDDGRGDMAEFAADVMLLAQPGGAAVRVSVGDAAVRVRAEDGPHAMLLAAYAFLDAADVSATRAWRVGELPPEHAVSAPDLVARAAAVGLAADPSGGAAASVGTAPPDGSASAGPVPHVGAGSAGDDAPGTRAGRETHPTGPVRRDRGAVAAVPARAGGFASAARPSAVGGAAPAPGDATPGHRPAAVAHGLPVPGAGPGGLYVVAPLGRLSAVQWRLVAEVAERHGTGELRVTPWRGVVVPGAGPEPLGVLAGAGLVTDPDSPWLGVGACTGRPGCAKSLADVRADATAHLAAGAGGLPVHWSGCERRCGHPRGARVDVVATGDGRYEVSAPGEAPPRAVPFPELADALAAARTTPTKTPTKAPTK
ncbi:cobalamin biosynthesis protein CobG [Streptomyces sp. NPDC006274]|uniref:cobalamin biosynthesis protein CobG n=1 Tax=unclassified Streptomyces TaxID=2593676 RepID=UPI0033B4D332